MYRFLLCLAALLGLSAPASANGGHVAGHAGFARAFFRPVAPARPVVLVRPDGHAGTFHQSFNYGQTLSRSFAGDCGTGTYGQSFGYSESYYAPPARSLRLVPVEPPADPCPQSLRLPAGTAYGQYQVVQGAPQFVPADNCGTVPQIGFRVGARAYAGCAPAGFVRPFAFGGHLFGHNLGHFHR